MNGIGQHGAFQVNRPNMPPGGHIPPPPPPSNMVLGNQQPVVHNGNPTQRQPMPMHNMQRQDPQHQMALVRQRQEQSMAIPSPPPQNLLPPHFREEGTVQISDIRKERGRMTESEARDALSEITIFRFELADRKNDYDSDGEPIQPTWAHARRTEVRGVSKKETAREIKELMVETRSVREKKASLTTAQQRQLERALEELESRETDPRYHTVLLQLDHKLRDKPTSESRYRSVSRHSRYVEKDKRHDNRKWGEKQRRTSDVRGRRETIVYRDSRDRRKSVDKRPIKKTVKETVSLTAYYKRCPKPDQDPVTMLMQRDAENGRFSLPVYPQQNFGTEQMLQSQYDMQQHQPQSNFNRANPNMGMNQGMSMINNMNNQRMSVPPPPPPPPSHMVNRQGQMPALPRPPMGNNNNLQRPPMGNNNNLPRPPMGNNNGMNRPRPIINNQRPNSRPPPPNRNRVQPSTDSSDSDSDSDSSGSSSDEDASSIMTPESSRSSRSNRHARHPNYQQQRRGSRGRGPKYIETKRDPKYTESPAHFGIPPKIITPHNSRHHSQHRMSDEFVNLTGKNTAPMRHMGVPSSSYPAPPTRELPSPISPVLPHHYPTVRRQSSIPVMPPIPPPYPVDLDEIEAKAYAAGRADMSATLRERQAQAQTLPRITEQTNMPRISQPPLIRRATIPTTTHPADLLDDFHHPLPRPPSPPRVSLPMRPRVVQHRPSIRHIRPGEPPLSHEERERERDVLDSLNRFRFDDEENRRRDQSPYRVERRGPPRRFGRVEEERYDLYNPREEARQRERDEITFQQEKERERLRLRRQADRLDEDRDTLDGRYGRGVYDDERFDERRERNPFAPIRPGVARRATVGFDFGGRNGI